MTTSATDVLPVILAVDSDPAALERITGELQRYARDYQVVCGPSAAYALSQLEAMRDSGRRVAVVLAARGREVPSGERSKEHTSELQSR